MRVALVYDHTGKRMLKNERGEPKAFAVFRWFHKIRHQQGWEFHFLALCSATTEDFKFQMYQGIVAFGKNYRRGFWFEFNPLSIHIGAPYA
jgi:hypothetical protein